MRDMKRTDLMSDVNEAVEIVIELGSLPTEIKNLKHFGLSHVGGDEAFLRTVARRLKYEYLLGRVVAVGDVGRAPKEVIYDAGIGWDTPFRIIRARPEGDILITPKTDVSAEYSEYQI